MKAVPPIVSFNGGELSPMIDGRTDIAKYAAGCRQLMNFIPTVQGPATRRGGTLHLGQCKDPVFKSAMLRFSRSATVSYMIEVTETKLRFWYDGELVVDGFSVPIEVTHPWNGLPFFDSDGCCMFGTVQSADVMYIMHKSQTTRKLSYVSALVWQLTEPAFADGPWKDGNSDRTVTVYASAATGSVTLTASSATFLPGHVGALFRLEQADLTNVDPWEPGQKSGVISVGTLRRSESKTYKCAAIGVGPQPPNPAGAGTNKWTQTGSIRPIHTDGDAWDGGRDTDFVPGGTTDWFTRGMRWTYQDSGYGVLKITAYTSATVVTATVVRQLPAACVGAGNASWKWEFGAWNSIDGYPAAGCFYKERLTFLGPARLWQSVSADFENFADREFGETLPDSAITLPLLSDQVNDAKWISAHQKSLFIGTLGGEFVVEPQTSSEPLGPANVSVLPISTFGGRQGGAVRVGSSTLFTDRSGRAVRDFAYAFEQDAFNSVDLSTLAAHVTESGIVSSAWAGLPDSLLWCALANGGLVSMTFNKEEKVYGWHPHNIGAGKVLQIVSIPSVTGANDDVILLVERRNEIGGIRYQFERISQALPLGGNQEDAFYVDDGLSLENTVAATLALVAGSATVGNTVAFTAGSSVFVADDVGRLIHYDYTRNETDTNGDAIVRRYKAVALITQRDSGTVVQAKVQKAFPYDLLTTLPSSGWRMTVTSITGGLGHLIGKTVAILADGGAQPDQVVPGSGIVPLAYPASKIHIGLSNPAILSPMRPEVMLPDGTAQGRIARVIDVVVRLANTLGGKIGRTLQTATPMKYRTPSTPMGEPPALYTGDTEVVAFPDGQNPDASMVIVQDVPLPITVVAIYANIEIERRS